MKNKYSDVLMDYLPINHYIKSNPVDIKIKEGVEVKPLFCTKARILLLHYQAETDRMIPEMLGAGVIWKSQGYSEWSSPATFVPKPTGGLRLVTDFFHLNKQIDRSIHPFPTTMHIQHMIAPSSGTFLKTTG